MSVVAAIVVFSTVVSAFRTSTTSIPQMKRSSTTSDAASSTTALSIFHLKEGETSNMFTGPRPLVLERDACGVGFIANVQASNSNGHEYGTHDVLRRGLHALECMEHRGACGGDGISGDGAGVMTQVPWKLFTQYISEDCPLPGVGMVFLPRDTSRRNAVKDVIQRVCEANELIFVG